MHRSAAAPAGHDLELLLAMEDRLDARRAEAHDEAHRIVAAAERDSAATRAAAASACRDAEADLAARIAAERDRAVADADAAAQRRVATLAATPPATIAALARRIVARVLGGGA